MKNSLRYVAALALVSQIAGCGSSGGSATATSSAPTSMGGAVSLAMAKAASSAPHIVVSAVVTAGVEKKSLFRKIVDELFPQAVAAVFGSMWDPETGNPPYNADVGIISDYFGSSSLYGCTTPGGTTGAASTGVSDLCSNGNYNYAFTEANGGGTQVPVQVSMKDWIGQELDPNFTNSNGSSYSTFGRLNSSMLVACVLGNLFPNLDADGTPTVTGGSPVTITLPAAGSSVYDAIDAGGCGLPVAYAGGPLGPITVTAVNGSSLYTKNVSLTTPANTTVNIFIGLDLTAGTMNAMQVEDQAQSGRNAVDRSIVEITGMGTSSTVIKFEYVSMGYNGARGGGASCLNGGNWSCSYEFHRIFVDNGNNIAYVLSNVGDPADASGTMTGSAHAPTKYAQFSGAALPNDLSACTASSCSTNLAISIGVGGQAGQNLSGLTADYDACIDANSRDIVTGKDGTLICAATGVTVNSGSLTGVIELSREFYAANLTNILNSDGSIVLSFTGASDFYTNATSQ